MKSFLPTLLAATVAISTCSSSVALVSTSSSNNVRIPLSPSSSSPLSPILSDDDSMSSLSSLPSSSLGESPTLTDTNLSPFLQEMVDEQRELQMNVGRAMDVLRKDYPYFLKRSPDYSIYSPQIQLHYSQNNNHILSKSLPTYKSTLSLTRSMLSLLYDPDRSVIQNRMVYDSTRCQIRISFNAMLVPKQMIGIGGAFGSVGLLGRTVHLDGISVYSMDVAPIVDKSTGLRREGGGRSLSIGLRSCW
eukprot:g8338.t1 g8338   contig29:287246-288154(+)